MLGMGERMEKWRGGKNEIRTRARNGMQGRFGFAGRRRKAAWCM